MNDEAISTTDPSLAHVKKAIGIARRIPGECSLFRLHSVLGGMMSSPLSMTYKRKLFALLKVLQNNGNIVLTEGIYKVGEAVAKQAKKRGVAANIAGKIGKKKVKGGPTPSATKGMRKKNALPKTKAKRPASKNAPVTKSVSKTPPAKKAKKPDVGHDLRSGNRSAPSYV